MDSRQSSGLGLSFSKKVALSLGGSLVLAEVVSLCESRLERLLIAFPPCCQLQNGTTQLMLHVPFDHRKGNGTARGSYVEVNSSMSHTASRDGEVDTSQEDCAGFVLPMITGYDDDEDCTEDDSTCDGSNHDINANQLADSTATVTGRSSTDMSSVSSPDHQRSPHMPLSDVTGYLPCTVPERAELPVIWEVPIMEGSHDIVPDAPSSKVLPLASPEGNRILSGNSEESGESSAPVPDVGSPQTATHRAENLPPISVARYLPPVDPSRRFSLTGTLSSTGSGSTRGIQGLGHSWKNRRSISRGPSGGASPDHGSARGNGCFLPPLIPPTNSLPLSSSRTSDSGGPASGRRSLRVLLYEPDRVVLRQMDTWERRSGESIRGIVGVAVDP